MTVSKVSPLLAFVLAILLASCSNARKKEKSDLNASLLGDLRAEPVLNEETVERLKEIADSPSSSLDDRDDMLDLAMADAEDTPDETVPTESDEEMEFASAESEEAEKEETSTDSLDEIVSEWTKNGLDPRSIEVGDIFSDHAGPILKKASSLADRMDLEDWTRTVNSIAEQRGSRVPVTLSVPELNELKTRTPIGAELPTRSVALDFRTISQSVSKPKLEKLYDLIRKEPEGLEIGDQKALKDLGDELERVKTRLEAGEQLYVITGVTQSDKMKATYPGAPLGSRDTELIENAVTALYPHLDNLTAELSEEAVNLTREPRIYWEFEVRELKLEEDKLIIDDQALAQL